MSARHAGLATIVLALAAGCGQRMRDQARVDPLEASAVFADGAAARSPVAGTAPWSNGEPPAPARSPLAAVERGRERYGIACAPCHGTLGDGRGMIVRHGFPAPPSFHTDAMRALPDSTIARVIATGFGRMHSLAAIVAPADREAIVLYVRALQRSRNASLADVPAADRARLASPP